MIKEINNEAEYQDAIQRLDELWSVGDIGPEFYDLEAAVIMYEQRMASEPRIHPVPSERPN